MTEPPTPTQTPTASDAASRTMDDDKTMPIVVYILYLLGFPSMFVTTFVGVVIAYAQKGRAGDIARSHYVFQIRTAWIGLLGLAVIGLIALIALPLTLVLIGLAFLWLAGGLMTLLSVWFAVRCVVGLIFIARDEGYPRPRAWLI